MNRELAHLTTQYDLAAARRTWELGRDSVRDLIRTIRRHRIASAQTGQFGVSNIVRGSLRNGAGGLFALTPTRDISSRLATGATA